MTKKNKILLGVGAVCLIACLCIVLVMCGGGNSNGDPTTTGAAVSGEPVTYTVQVKNQGGLFLSNVGVYIYEDDTLAELVWFAKTDDSGKMTFTDVPSESYMAVLTDVPTGYAVEAMYPITGELTEIVLSAAQMSETDVTEVTYELGDMMMDFTVEDAAGDTYTLSKLLEQKKAVVLNFWYAACAPCKAEFPYLQEAYEKNSDDIAVLAMNPVDDADVVAAFQKEMGLTFPMMACDPAWAQMMQITAYPTTVVIDRYGNITLIHKGSIDNTKTFEDTFAYFAAEEYQQKLIKDITELLTEEEEGSKENPIELGGVMSFEVTVKPGEVVYTDLYKVTNMYLQIQSKYAYVIYNDKTYKPENDVVGLVVNAPDTYTPAKIGIGNSGTETLTFKAYLSILRGTLNNPYELTMGEFEASVSAGNEQGIYYTYTVPEDGVLTMQCLSVTAGVEYSYFLYNLDSGALRNLGADGATDAAGVTTVSVQAKKGQTIQFSVGTLPDENNSYPAAKFKFSATFTTGTIKEEEKVEKISYTVTVKDTNGDPISNVKVFVNVEETVSSFATDATGVATIQLPTGSYKGTFTLPEGYDPVESTEFELTAEKTSYEVTLAKTVIIMHDYVVKVVDSGGAAVSGVKVKIGDVIVTTTQKGIASFNLQEDTYTVLIHELPDVYTADTEEYPFPMGKTEVQIVLAVKPGTVGNPYQVSQYPYDTASIESGKEQHYALSNAGGMVLNIRNASAYVIYNEKKYEAQDGLVSVPLADVQTPAGVVIGNNSTESGSMRFTLRLSYPVGSKENPESLAQLGQTTVGLAAGNTKGYYYNWTAEEVGTVHFGIDSITDGVAADIILTVGETTVKLSDTQGDPEVSSWVEAGDVVSVQVIALPDSETGEIPAVQIAVSSAFKLPPNSAQYPDVLTNISQIDVSLAEGDTDGWFYTWTSANSGVASFTISSITEGVTGDVILSVAGSETVVKLSDGMVDGDGKPVAAITVARGDVLSVQVTAEGKEAQLAVSGSLTQDPNSTENPDAVQDIAAINASLVAGDTDGHYYVWTAAYNGTVSFRIGSVTDGVQGDLTLCVNGVEHPLTGGVASADVKAGDEVLIHVQASADGQTGEYPAAQITVNGSFVHEVGSIQNPKPVANISQLTTTLETGDSDGYHYSWTATENCTVVFYISEAYKNGVAPVADTTDSAEWADIVLYVNGTRKSSLSENEVKDSAGNRIVSAVVKEGDLVTVQVTTLADSQTGEYPAAIITTKCRSEISYKVTVTDMFGKAQSGVAVTVWDPDGNKVYAASTDESGDIIMVGESGTYSVELAFEGTAYYYDKTAAVLTAARPTLTVRLADYLDTTDTYEDLWALNGAVTYNLQQGSTYVEIGTNKAYYCEEQNGTCLFIFHPTQGGTYRFSVDNPNVEITYRNSPYFLFEIATSAGTEDNSFTYSIGNNTAGNIDMVIGIKAADGISGVVVSITRVGDPNWSIEDEPWSTEWKKGHTHSSDCAVANSASTVTYLDINAASGTYELYYNEAADVYQLYKDGPVVLVDMNASLMSFYRIIKGDGSAGGAPIRRYFYDENGFVKKEDYTETFMEYFDCAGMTSISQKGYHPLTKDLMYMIQNGGAVWWDSNSGSQVDTLVNANPEYAWMFACCYIDE